MDHRSRSLIVGLALIAVGVLSLRARFWDLEEMTGRAVPWIVAAAFFTVYANRRQLGFLIAGSMVAAVGTFVLLQARPFWRLFESGGLFFILIAVAFFLVYLVGTRPNPWPIFPALATMVFFRPRRW
ncbi:MAG: hypothetical protein ACYC9Q_00535 [Bacillota bacterium]